MLQYIFSSEVHWIHSYGRLWFIYCILFST